MRSDSGPQQAIPDTIHEAVSRQAALRPRDPAVVCGEDTVDYGTLDAAAEVYARELAVRGVEPGHMVPTLLPRSPHLVAVLLAVLKLGASYAALDPEWPLIRRTELLRRLDPPVVITGLPDTPTGQWPVWHPTDPDLYRAASRCDSVVSAPADGTGVDGTSPACVFFTSGSTGGPKGVISPHRATTRMFGDGFGGFGPGTVMLQSAPLPWDAHSLELWGMLATGGTAVLAAARHLMPQALRNAVRAHGVNTLFLTTALFNLFVDEDDECFTGLRTVFTGGERVSAHHMHRFLTRHPRVRLVHAYGPVENCMFATTHPVTPADCDGRDEVPIGSAVPGTRVLVMDGQRPCRAGEAGEICLAGPRLAHGYLGDPELSARSFVTVTPEAGQPVRVYRTGDRGVLDGAGTLRFLGRIDRQVKIRGHRIEPAEVERAAMQLPGVRRAVALPVPGDDGGYGRLALFCVAADDSATSICRALAERLPSYLLPDIAHLVDELPLNSNGKLDRAALLAGVDRGAAVEGQAR